MRIFAASNDKSNTQSIQIQMKMNRILSIAAAAVMVIAAASCRSDKQSDQSDTNVVTLEEAEAIFSSELAATDTTQVLELGNNFMETMKEGKVDEALDMLYTRNMDDAEGGVRKLNEEERDRLKSRFERFPIVSYQIDHYDFSIPALNDLKYTYVYNPEAPSGKLNLMFNPTKRDGVWYLMLKQADQPAKDAENALPANTGIQMPENK